MIDAALDLFATRGYGKTTTKAISEHAGVATGLVFYHFESKEALLRATLVERSIEPELARLGDGLPSDSARALHAIGRDFVAVVRANTNYLTVLLGARGQMPEQLQGFGAALDELATAVGSHLASASGHPAGRSRAAARVFLTSLLSAVMLLPGRSSDRSLVRTHAAAVLGGLTG